MIHEQRVQSSVYYNIITKAHAGISHVRLLFKIDDVEEIAAPNLMRTETAKEYVNFTFWHKLEIQKERLFF